MSGADQRSSTRLEFLRPFTTHVVNRFFRHFVRWLPGFALICYRGRKSGKAYRTPMTVFRDEEEYIFCLPYGSDVQWVQNVLFAGEADLQVRNRTIHLVNPRLFADPSRRLMPAFVRAALRLARASEFLRMTPAGERSS